MNTMPTLPFGWKIASITVRRDHGWCYGGATTYDALLERDGGDREMRGTGADPCLAVADAITRLAPPQGGEG